MDGELEDQSTGGTQHVAMICKFYYYYQEESVWDDKV